MKGLEGLMKKKHQDFKKMHFWKGFIEYQKKGI